MVPPLQTIAAYAGDSQRLLKVPYCMFTDSALDSILSCSGLPYRDGRCHVETDLDMSSAFGVQSPDGNGTSGFVNGRVYRTAGSVLSLWL